MCSELAWDIRNSRLEYKGVYISILHPRLSKPNFSAIVEEQDTSLALSEFRELHDPGELPVWYLGHKAASDPAKKLGSVVVRACRPFIFQAIIHELDEDPTWCEEWISEALDNIFSLVSEKQVTSLCIPALGHVHGRMTLKDSISLIMDRLKVFLTRNPSDSAHKPLKKIWIQVDKNEYLEAVSILNEWI